MTASRADSTVPGQEGGVGLGSWLGVCLGVCLGVWRRAPPSPGRLLGALAVWVGGSPLCTEGGQ